MKETAIETPLIGSGSQEEADKRVRDLLGLGTSRGYLTYEELNEKLPDEVVSPDKLDSLLMMIDEMGIRLIDEHDVRRLSNPPAARRVRQGQRLARQGKGKKAAAPARGERSASSRTWTARRST